MLVDHVNMGCLKRGEFRDIKLNDPSNTQVFGTGRKNLAQAALAVDYTHLCHYKLNGQF